MIIFEMISPKKIVKIISDVEIKIDKISPVIKMFFVLSGCLEISVAIAVGSPNCVKVIKSNIIGFTREYMDIASTPIDLTIKIRAIIERSLPIKPKPKRDKINVIERFFFNFCSLIKSRCFKIFNNHILFI